LIEAGAGPDGLAAAAATGDAAGEAAGDAAGDADAAAGEAGAATGAAGAAGDAGAAAGAAGLAGSAGFAVGAGAADGPHAMRRTASAVRTGSRRTRNAEGANRIIVSPSRVLVIHHWSTDPAQAICDGQASARTPVP